MLVLCQISPASPLLEVSKELHFPSNHCQSGIPKEFADILCVPALRLAVELYRESLRFDDDIKLARLLANRKVKREKINAAAEKLTRSASKAALKDVDLGGGNVALGCVNAVLLVV